MNAMSMVDGEACEASYDPLRWQSSKPTTVNEISNISPTSVLRSQPWNLYDSLEDFNPIESFGRDDFTKDLPFPPLERHGDRWLDFQPSTGSLSRPWEILSSCSLNQIDRSSHNLYATQAPSEYPIKSRLVTEVLLYDTQSWPESSGNEHNLVEVSPGFVVRLRGYAETKQACENLEEVASTKCACCEVTLHCVKDAEFVLCQGCNFISPVRKAKTHSSDDFSVGGGLGLGLLRSAPTRMSRNSAINFPLNSPITSTNRVVKRQERRSPCVAQQPKLKKSKL